MRSPAFLEDRRSGGARLALAFLAALALAGAAAPLLTPYDPTAQPDPVAGKHRPPLTVMAAVELDHGGWLLADRVERTAAGLEIERLGRTELLPLERVRNLSPDGVRDRWVYLLGSDRFSRDVLSRWLYGARVSLWIGSLALVLALVLGTAIGAIAALGGPWIDGLLMRTVDALLSFPWVLLVITLAAFFPNDVRTLVLLLGATAWMGVARLMRAELLSLKERDFILAARGLGAGPVNVFFRHLLPNALNPLLADGTLRIGRLILAEASLSFLGFGVQPPHPSWGNMIAESRGFMLSAWWVALFPGLTLVATVVALSLASDALRDRLDPRMSGGHSTRRRPAMAVTEVAGA